MVNIISCYVVITKMSYNHSADFDLAIINLTDYNFEIKNSRIVKEKKIRCPSWRKLGKSRTNYPE